MHGFIYDRAAICTSSSVRENRNALRI